MTAASDEELQADIDELEQLQTMSNRSHVRALLQTHATHLRAELNQKLSKRSLTAPAAPVEVAVTASSPAAATTTGPPKENRPPQQKPLVAQAPTPVRLEHPAISSGNEITYVPIGSHSWDQDSYGKDPNNVYVYILSGFDGIGEHKECVSCEFTKNSFDLKVNHFNGKSYRLVKTNLDKNIIAEESKVIVKKNSIKICLRKEKGKYGYDTWMDLTAKRQKTEDIASDDPSKGIMDIMKQMYDDGDDQMKKTIGEAMVKSRQKQVNPGMADDF